MKRINLKLTKLGYTTNMVRLEWTPSGDKHGIAHEDVIHAIGEGRRWFVAKFERSRIIGDPDPSLFVGVARDGVTLLEVMVVPEDPDTLVVFHVMEARSRTVDIARRQGRRKEQQR